MIQKQKQYICTFLNVHIGKVLKMETSFFISDEAGALLRFFPIGVPQRNAMVGLVFVLTTAGQATVEIDNRSYTLSAGALLTLLPSRLLRSVMCTDDFRCLTFAFRFDD